MMPNDTRSPKASSQAARLEPRWHGSTMSAHRLCHGSFPLIGPDWLILTTQSDDRIRPLLPTFAAASGNACPCPETAVRRALPTHRNFLRGFPRRAGLVPPGVCQGALLYFGNSSTAGVFDEITAGH